MSEEKIDYRKMATDLVENVSDLQKQVLIKHTKAILEELHEQVKEMTQRAEASEHNFAIEHDKVTELEQQLANSLNKTQLGRDYAQMWEAFKAAETKLTEQDKQIQGLVEALEESKRLCDKIINSPPETEIRGDIESMAFSLAHLIQILLAYEAENERLAEVWLDQDALKRNIMKHEVDQK